MNATSKLTADDVRVYHGDYDLHPGIPPGWYGSSLDLLELGTLPADMRLYVALHARFTPVAVLEEFVRDVCSDQLFMWPAPTVVGMFLSGGDQALREQAAHAANEYAHHSRVNGTAVPMRLHDKAYNAGRQAATACFYYFWPLLEDRYRGIKEPQKSLIPIFTRYQGAITWAKTAYRNSPSEIPKETRSLLWVAKLIDLLKRYNRKDPLFAPYEE